MRRLPLLLAIVGSLAAPAAAKPGEPGVVVTIYNPGEGSDAFGVVTDRRKMTVPQGAGELKFPGVAGELLPATAHVEDETDPSTAITSRSFVHDLSSIDAMLARFLGQQISIVTAESTISGTLLAYDAAQYVVRTDDAKMPIQIVMRGENVRNIRFGALPGGLVDQPTFIAGVDAKKAGDHVLALTYVTRGLAWAASYSVVLGGDDKRADFEGWLSITNTTTARFADAVIRIVDGDVFRPDAPPAAAAAVDDEGAPVAAPQVMKPPAFRETLDHPATLGPGETRELQLVALSGATGKRTIAFEHKPPAGAAMPNLDQSADPGNGEQVASQLDTFLELPAPAQALPPGPLRVFRRSADGLELVSEDAFAGSDAQQPIRVRLGSNTDISAHRRQSDWQLDEAAKELREKFDVDFTNKQKDAVEVVVVEHMWRATSWSLEGPSQQPASKDATTARFVVKIPPGATKTLEYTVLYTW